MRLSLCVALMLLVGCSSGSGEGSRIHGKVTFKGNPVPSGRIYFDPDPKQNSGGQQGFADITDGQFDTGKGGKSPSPGAVIVRIDGFEKGSDPNSPGPALFVTFEEKLTISSSETQKDFEVPASAASKLPKNNGPQP